MSREPNIEARFWMRVRKGEGCWEWLGSKQSQGYGRIEIRRRAYAAHRLSYEINVGPIPTGAVIDHRCSNKGCVNPSHLEAVSPSENAVRYADSTMRGRTP